MKVRANTYGESWLLLATWVCVMTANDWRSALTPGIHAMLLNRGFDIFVRFLLDGMFWKLEGSAQ